MKKTTFLIILPLLCAFLFMNMKCKKEPQIDPDGLPKATQTGAMIFACKINGENWISKKSVYSLGGSIENDLIAVHGVNDSNESRGFERLDIQLDKVSSVMLYKLDDPSGRFATYTTSSKCFDVVEGIGRAKSSAGEVYLTRIDRASRIISGTFWCDISTEKCGVIKITDGRFDIRY